MPNVCPFMKTLLLLSLLFVSGVSVANQNSTFANAINAETNRTETSDTPTRPDTPQITVTATPSQTQPNNRQTSDTASPTPPKPTPNPQTKEKDKNKEQPTETTPSPDVPANPHNPANGTLLEGITPNDSELSRANTELLAKNAELTRQVDDLSTQVNVLVQERSGQLFVYGAMTAIVSVVIGFVLAKLLTRQRW